MAEEMFDGFDHTQYKDEVEEKWGKDAYAKSDAWWRAKTDEEKRAWKRRARRARRGVDRDVEVRCDTGQRRGPGACAAAVRLVARHPGNPGRRHAGPTKEYFTGLGEMYVADERFGANYGGPEGATFVRDTLRVYADRNL